METTDGLGNKALRLAALKEKKSSRQEGQRRPRVLVLVGIPGSGKSTFANLLRDIGFQVVCQDDLRDRKTCEIRTTQHLLQDKDVVVDRCNFDATQRRHWVEYGGACGAELGVIVFGTPFQVCVERVRNRFGHPTLKPKGESDHIVMTMAKNFMFPTQREGFAFCRVVREDADATRIYDELAAWVGASVQN